MVSRSQAAPQRQASVLEAPRRRRLAAHVVVGWSVADRSLPLVAWDERVLG
jgi:hypothetical protein